MHRQTRKKQKSQYKKTRGEEHGRDITHEEKIRFTQKEWDEMDKAMMTKAPDVGVPRSKNRRKKGSDCAKYEKPPIILPKITDLERARCGHLIPTKENPVTGVPWPRPWDDDEFFVLRRDYGKKSVRDIAQSLNRGIKSITEKGYQLGLSKNRGNPRNRTSRQGGGQ